jgi:hypothetical protein
LSVPATVQFGFRRGAHTGFCLQHKGVVGGRVGAVHRVGAHRGRVLLLQQLLDNAAREGLENKQRGGSEGKKISKGGDSRGESRGLRK